MLVFIGGGVNPVVYFNNMNIQSITSSMHINDYFNIYSFLLIPFIYGLFNYLIIQLFRKLFKKIAFCLYLIKVWFTDYPLYTIIFILYAPSYIIIIIIRLLKLPELVLDPSYITILFKLFEPLIRIFNTINLEIKKIDFSRLINLIQYNYNYRESASSNDSSTFNIRRLVYTELFSDSQNNGNDNNNTALTINDHVATSSTSPIYDRFRLQIQRIETLSERHKQLLVDLEERSRNSETLLVSSYGNERKIELSRINTNIVTALNCLSIGSFDFTNEQILNCLKIISPYISDKVAVEFILNGNNIYVPDDTVFYYFQWKYPNMTREELHGFIIETIRDLNP
uniref:hypothetical protein n=1 Tax=Cutaneotrichosporon mucoides TaxID=82522 RepID=UPI00226C8EDF|nr:hypothetical protein OYW89_mgp09 [Cutaneotrichosporon mucoides]UZC57687.1 hypothetical protein [Cutaneotrichosporon mucoides]